MANTREVLGDQATLDGLVSQTLESFEDDSIDVLGTGAFYYNSRIKSVSLPGLTNLSKDCFRNCVSLSTVNIPDVTIIDERAFVGCTSLRSLDVQSPLHSSVANAAFSGASNFQHLILRGEDISGIHSASVFNGTPLYDGLGAVYVPSNLVEAYKSDSSWKSFNIFPLSAYPASEFGTITDSWAEIIAAEDNGTYNTKYSVGDTKTIQIGEKYIQMQIVAFDTDFLSEGGYAKITWISKHCVDTLKYSAFTTWKDSVLSTLDVSLRDAIKLVNKYTYLSNSAPNRQGQEYIWIPSAREMFGSTTFESTGCEYSSFFTSNSSRLKKVVTNTKYSEWWLRSVFTSSSQRSIDTSGKLDYESTSNMIGCVIGFCT